MKVGRKQSALSSASSKKGRKSYGFTISPKAMQRQAEYKKQLEVDRRLSISKREATRAAVCNRKGKVHSS